MLDLELNVDGWCVHLSENDYKHSRIFVEGKSRVDNILTDYKIELDDICITDRKPPYIYSRHTKEIKTLRNCISDAGFIKLFNSFKISKKGNGYIYVFIQSLDLKDLNDRINKILDTYTNLYYSPSNKQFSTDEEIKNFFNVEFKLFDINISDLYPVGKKLGNTTIFRFTSNSLVAKLYNRMADRKLYILRNPYMIKEPLYYY